MVVPAPWSETTRRAVNVAGGNLIGERLLLSRQGPPDPTRAGRQTPGSFKPGRRLKRTRRSMRVRVKKTGHSTGVPGGRPWPRHATTSRLVRQRAAESKQTVGSMQIKSTVTGPAKGALLPAPDASADIGHGVINTGKTVGARVARAEVARRERWRRFFFRRADEWWRAGAKPRSEVWGAGAKNVALRSGAGCD